MLDVGGGVEEVGPEGVDEGQVYKLVLVFPKLNCEQRAVTLSKDPTSTCQAGTSQWRATNPPLVVCAWVSSLGFELAPLGPPSGYPECLGS